VIRIERYCDSQAAMWDRFVAESKNGTFLIQRSYMDYHSDRFQDHSLFVYHGDELAAVLPANVREQVLHSHQGLTYGGFIASNAMRAPLMLDIFDAFAAHARSRGWLAVHYKPIPHIYHRAPAEEDLYALFRAGATLVRSDVTSAISRRFPLGYSRRRQRGIIKAQKAGVRFERSEDYECFFQLVTEILKTKYQVQPTHTATEMALLAGRFPDQIALWVARGGKDEMLAGAIMYATSQVSHAQYIATSPQGRHCGALDALFDYLIGTVYAATPVFDFGISTEQQGKVLNAGLVSQKEEFGARSIVHQTWAWYL
jgi:Acetyltransferase (GNAT) domain